MRSSTASDLEDRALDDARARALQPVLPSPQPDGRPEERPEREPYRCAFALGFSLHANVALAADDRKALLRLVRYGARQAFSQQQLAELPDGRLR
jgi:hypothetical protein